MQIFKLISLLSINLICLSTAVNSFAQKEQIVFKLKEDVKKSSCISPSYLCSDFESTLQLPFTLNNKTAVAHSYSEMTFTAKVNKENIQEVINEMMATGKFEYVESDFIAEPLATDPTPTLPNDENFNKQWAYKNNGDHEYVYSKQDADIDMEYAWSHQQGSQGITVAILDTGVDYTHPDLQNRMWVNETEIPGNGIDDDNNGYIDDVKGYDFAESDNDPMDTNGHGTHVAGIIGAEAGNDTGFTGVDWNCKLMALKVVADNSTANYSDYAAAVYYAVAMGAKVINLSLTSYNPSMVIEDAFAYAHSQDVVIVVAMANNGNRTIHYMAQSPYSIAVGATTPSDKRASFSNFNPYIDVVAPGTFIYGLNRWNHQDDYFIMNGTSQATPFVSGIAALLLAQDMTRTPEQIRQIIQLTAEDQIGPAHEDLPGYDDYFGYGRINAYEALVYASNQNEQPLFHGEAEANNTCQIGLPCDDNNSCTVNDVIVADCLCQGTVEDNLGCEQEDVSCMQLHVENFENRRRSWIVKGRHARLEERLSQTGKFGARIEANHDEHSSIKTSLLDYSDFREVTVSFSYETTNMKRGDQFVFEVSNNGGRSFLELESWSVGRDFQNDVQQNGSVFISKQLLTNRTVFRFRSIAGHASTGVHIDNILQEGCRELPQIVDGLASAESNQVQTLPTEDVEIVAFPNPTVDQITLDHPIFSSQETKILIYTQMGSPIYRSQFSVVDEVKIDVSAFASGMYHVQVVPSQSTSSFSTSFFKH